MAQVHNDPNAIESLRKSLNDTIANLKDQQKTCKELIKEAASFWKDDSYGIFSQEYDDGTKIFEKLFEKMEDYDNNLKTLEIRLREYKKIKPKISRR